MDPQEFGIRVKGFEFKDFAVSTSSFGAHTGKGTVRFASATVARHIGAA